MKLTPRTDSTYDEHVDEARQLIREQEAIAERLQELVHEWAAYGLMEECGDLISLAIGLNDEEGC